MGIERAGNPDHKFQYNGKEKQTELGLNWVDYGWRNYDAQIGRWHVVDPMTEIHYDLTPYNYVMNNPLKFTDPMGLDTLSATTSSPVKKGDVIHVGQDDDGNDIFITSNVDESVVKGSGNDQQNTSTPSIFPDRDPYQGFFGNLDFYWNGGNENGFRYDINGRNLGLSYAGGSDLGLIGGVGKLPGTIDKGIKALKYIGKQGKRPDVRIVEGGIAKATEVWNSITKEAQIIPGNIPGQIFARFKDGKVWGFRSAVPGKPATIDLPNGVVPGLKKIKFE